MLLLSPSHVIAIVIFIIIAIAIIVVIIIIFVITIMIVIQVQSWEGAAEEEEECSIEGMPCIKVINTNFSLLTMIRLLIDYYHYFW